MDGVRVSELDARELDTHALCALVSERHRFLVDVECELLELAALWADHYSALPDVEDDGPVLPGAEKLKMFGGDGTPQVWEFAPSEFGALQHMSMYAASNTIANALDLRHRLPLIWARVRAGEVRTWQACKIADATHSLSHAAAGFVDRAMVDALTQLPWGRCQKRLAAKIIEADPEMAERLARERAAERFVRTGRSEDGFKTVFARATAGDVLWLDATLDRIAGILAVRGDTDTVDVRRSKALGIIAQPARALLLLAEYDDTLFADDLIDHTEIAEPGANAGPTEPGCPGAEGQRADGDQEETQLSDGDLIPEQREGSEAEAVTVRNAALVRERLQTLQPADLLPPVTLYLHLHADTLAGQPGAVRFEGVGPITMSQLRDLLGTGCSVRIQPVIDLDDVPSSDAYEAPERLKDALLLRNPAEAFPYGTCTSRGMDFDHTINYRPPERGGPPGQTRIGNGALLSRRSHRMKTHGRWQLRQPERGSYLWRSPHGWIYLVNATGNHDLGRGQFAQQMWDTASNTTGMDVVSAMDRSHLPVVD